MTEVKLYEEISDDCEEAELPDTGEEESESLSRCDEDPMFYHKGNRYDKHED